MMKADRLCLLKVFLERSGARAINSDSLNPPNPDCPVCSPVLVRVEVDFGLATFEHLIKDVLQGQLGYGEDISVLVGTELIYDVELTDNLARKLSDFGIKSNSFITVKDDNDTDARVDIDVLVTER